ncbi:MAG: type II/IV secretion system ATPase subunit [Chloroflexi bacterium]|nr:type II/IV secretion system ATPase subunit [Chloroflexota bacterium]
MAVFELPFNVIDTRDHECDSESCELVQQLPTALREAALENSFLLRYLHSLPIAEIGIPTYHEELEKSDGDEDSPNIIYKAHAGGTFIHVFADPEGIRDWYIAIEPSAEHPKFPQIMADIEEGLIEYTDELEAAEGDQQLAGILRWVLAQIFKQPVEMEIDEILALPKGFLGEEIKKAEDEPPALPEGAEDSAGTDAGGESNSTAVAVAEKTETAVARPKKKSSLLAPLVKLFGGGSKSTLDIAGKYGLDEDDLEGIKYSMVREKVGLGVLQPMINDHHIEDISCSGVGQIFIEHKIFLSMKASFGYKTHAELDEHVLRLSERIKKPVTFRQPVVDASLPDGSRINIVYGQDVSLRGTNYTIRKFSEDPISIIQLCKWRSLNWEMAAYLSIMIEDGMNMFVSGETASGKTTLMNALCTFIPPNAKIVSIEDTAEVNVPHQNWIKEVTRKPKSGETDSGVGMFDLLRAALRQRPEFIIIGEIRGEEGLIAFQAMQTGHPVMATFHASSVQKLIQRLVGDPILVPKNYIDNLNIAVMQVAVRLPDGSVGRRAISINEIVNYDSAADAFSFVEVFQWDPVTDTFDFTGFNNSYLLEQIIAPARGYPPARRRQIYSLVKRRARILEKLAASGLEGYQEVYRTIAKAIKDGVF